MLGHPQQRYSNAYALCVKFTEYNTKPHPRGLGDVAVMTVKSFVFK